MIARAEDVDSNQETAIEQLLKRNVTFVVADKSHFSMSLSFFIHLGLHLISNLKKNHWNIMSAIDVPCSLVTVFEGVRQVCRKAFINATVGLLSFSFFYLRPWSRQMYTRGSVLRGALLSIK